MTVSVTLRQEKTILSDQYRVVSWVTAADPSGMYPLFVVTEGLAVWEELFTKIADLDDLANYAENALVRFTDTVVNIAGLSGLIVGDVLTITTAVPEWIGDFFTVQTFIIAAITTPLVGDSYVLVQSTKPFPTAKNVLSWSIDSSGGTPRGSGTNGYTSREDETDTTYLRRHWTSLLGTVEAAESRVESNKTGVESVVNAANVHGTVFPGIDTETYP